MCMHLFGCVWCYFPPWTTGSWIPTLSHAWSTVLNDFGQIFFSFLTSVFSCKMSTFNELSSLFGMLQFLDWVKDPSKPSGSHHTRDCWTHFPNKHVLQDKELSECVVCNFFLNCVSCSLTNWDEKHLGLLTRRSVFCANMRTWVCIPSIHVKSQAQHHSPISLELGGGGKRIPGVTSQLVYLNQ